MTKRRMTTWDRIIAAQKPAREWPSGPVQHHSIVGGRLAVSVRLNGKSGKGRSMLIDAADWDRVKLVIGERWHVSRTGDHEYVVAYGDKAAKLAPRPSKGLTLSRWATWAQPGEIVWHRDGNGLNLCRSNLEVVVRREFLTRMQRGAFPITPVEADPQQAPSRPPTASSRVRQAVPGAYA